MKEQQEKLTESQIILLKTAYRKMIVAEMAGNEEAMNFANSKENKRFISIINSALDTFPLCCYGNKTNTRHT